MFLQQRLNQPVAFLKMGGRIGVVFQHRPNFVCTGLDRPQAFPARQIGRYECPLRAVHFRKGAQINIM